MFPNQRSVFYRQQSYFTISWSLGFPAIKVMTLVLESWNQMWQASTLQKAYFGTTWVSHHHNALERLPWPFSWLASSIFLGGESSFAVVLLAAVDNFTFHDCWVGWWISEVWARLNLAAVSQDVLCWTLTESTQQKRQQISGGFRLIDLWIEWTTSLFLGGMIKLQMSKDLKETTDFMERDLDDFICIHSFYPFCVSVWERPPKGHSISHTHGIKECTWNEFPTQEMKQRSCNVFLVIYPQWCFVCVGTIAMTTACIDYEETEVET